MHAHGIGAAIAARCTRDGSCAAIVPTDVLAARGCVAIGMLATLHLAVNGFPADFGLLAVSVRVIDRAEDPATS
jgi:hypothetical protein